VVLPKAKVRGLQRAFGKTNQRLHVFCKVKLHCNGAIVDSEHSIHHESLRLVKNM